MKNKKTLFAVIILLVIIIGITAILLIIFRKSPAELKAEKYFKERGKRQIEALKGLSEIATDIAGNARIDFYGRVIDEDGKPLPNVKVTLEIKSTDTSPAGVLNMIRIAEQNYTRKEKIVHTDANGEFKIENESGVFMDIKVEKDGYVYAAAGKTHLAYPESYPDHYIPDKSKPEIYRLWREDKTEPLIKLGRGYVFPKGKDFVIINLITEEITEKSEDADIRVYIKSPDNITWGDEYYDWSCSIEAINGGLIETNDEQFYLAPENGYAPSYSYQIKAEDKDNWKYNLKKKYYLKSRKGKIHGGIIVEYYPVFGKPAGAYLVVSSILNPHSSRVLVYNSDKRITDPHEFYKENFSEEYKALKEKEEQRLKAIRERAKEEEERKKEDEDNSGESDQNKDE